MQEIIEIFLSRAALHTEILALRQLSFLKTSSAAEILAFQPTACPCPSYLIDPR